MPNSCPFLVECNHAQSLHRTWGFAAPKGAAGRPNRELPMKIRRLERPAGRRGPVGVPRAPGGPWRRHDVGSYIDGASIRDSRATRRHLIGTAVLSCQIRVPMETCRNPDMVRRTRRALNGDSTVPYWCTIDIRNHMEPHGTLACSDGANLGPTKPMKP